MVTLTPDRSQTKGVGALPISPRDRARNFAMIGVIPASIVKLLVEPHRRCVFVAGGVDGLLEARRRAAGETRV